MAANISFSADTQQPRLGRGRIPIQFIMDRNRRQVTFSKRKAGIMKKAFELPLFTWVSGPPLDRGAFEWMHQNLQLPHSNSDENWTQLDLTAVISLVSLVLFSVRQVTIQVSLQPNPQQVGNLNLPTFLPQVLSFSPNFLHATREIESLQEICFRPDSLASLHPAIC